MHACKQLVYFEFALNLLLGVQAGKNELLHAKHILPVEDVGHYLTLLAEGKAEINIDFLCAMAVASLNKIVFTIDAEKNMIVKKEMNALDVIEFLKLCEQNDIEIIIDGGWGVDALLGKQTRTHGDLDIALQHKYVPKLRQLLEAKGYKNIPRDDTKESNFVMGDDKGHEIDFHSYTFDAAGNHIFGTKYPLESLTGVGKINDYPVKCISPEWMVKFHTGYNLDENDYRDVLALCEHFGIPLPSEYEKFSK